MKRRAATRVLVVEDEPTDALLVRRSLLRAEGGDGRFEVRQASTLAEALDSLRREPADVLLLDLSLPDSEGLDTVVRSRVRAPNLPLVVLTGSDDPELAARTLEAGADGHLVKGERVAHALPRALRDAIERRHPSRQHAPAPAQDGPEPERALLHDLRNLNTLVVANAEILRDELASHPRLRARVDALLRAARLAASATQRLFAGEAEAGPQTDAVDLSALVRGVDSLLRSLVPERIRLRYALAGDLEAVTVRVEALFGALLELVANAVESIGEGAGTLELTTGAGVTQGGPQPGLVAHHELEPGPHVFVEVRDSGRGFDSASLFQQLRVTRPAEGGQGYGASHLEQLLADGVGLLVESQPGAGASFRILIPTRRPAAG